MGIKKIVNGLASAKHPLYGTWRNMKTRCLNKKFRNFDVYGAKGIKVCDRWMNFSLFALDMGDKPDPSYSLDRIDSDGDYEPANCRWASPVTQGRNTSRVILIEFCGEKRCLPDWAKKLDINWMTLKSRIKSGWSIERCLTTPANRYSPRI
jgi:hypothetical protein